MTRVVLVNRYFYPDHSATSQLLSDLAFHLALQGREVHVVTSRQRYDEPGAQLTPQETVRGVVVHRVWTSAFGRGNLVGRAFDYLTFYVGAGIALMRLVAHGDTVVAKTDPPLLSLVAWPAAKLKGARLVNWLQDVFPEVAGAVGMGWARGWVGRLLARLRDRSLRAAHLNVVVGSGARRYLASRGLDAERMRVIPNWADGELVWPVKPENNHLRREWGLGGKFVVGYSGNMGRVHDFETTLGAAEALKGHASIIFLLVGNGVQRKWLEEEVERQGLANVRFRPYQPSERLTESLSVPDVHLISLRPEVEGYVVPSKFYSIAAAGRPAIFVGAENGEIARVINEARCGIVVPTGANAELAAAIRKLRDDPALCRSYGESARRAFEERFDRRIALEAWGDVLSAGSQTSPATPPLCAAPPRAGGKG